MKTKWYLGVLVVICLSLFVTAGCSTKKTSSMPPGATKVKVEDDSKWTPPPAPEAPQPQVDEEALKAEAEARARTQAIQELTDARIQFAFDSYELNEDSRALLAVKASIMRNYADTTVVIEGYCDERGTEEYNLALGERRARAAYEHLVILGVAPERMSIVSFGEERPVDPAHNETAWAKNRRAEFVVQ